jgi:hypothetical protein
MTKVTRIVDSTYLQFVAPGDGGGRFLEVCIGENNGTFPYIEPYPLAKILETDDYKMWLEIETPNGCIRLALAELESAIATAKQGGVFSERRFDEEISPPLAPNPLFKRDA